MTQLSKLKVLLENPQESDELLQFYLDCASDIICDIRFTESVEKRYLTTQLRIAVELYNKRGAEGEISHTELGISRSYEKSDVSQSLLLSITPVIRTPFSRSKVI